MKVTDKQIWFWEQCGVVKKEQYGQKYLIFPNGCCFNYYDEDLWHRSIPIDLNNLFEYAETSILLKVGSAGWLHILNMWVYEVAIQHKDPANSLFNLIYKALGGKE